MKSLSVTSSTRLITATSALTICSCALSESIFFMPPICVLVLLYQYTGRRCKMKTRFNSNQIKWNLVGIQLTEHKGFAYQLDLGNGLATEFFELSFIWTTKQDHAGPRFCFSIYHLFFLQIQIYDNRHWDFDTQSWEKTIG